MDAISISQLKMNPAQVIQAAGDYPVAIANRNKIEAYVIGKDLLDRLEKYVEDFVDRQAIETTDFSKGTDLKVVMKKLGI